MTAIVVEQRIEAPPATVYRFLTEPDKWAQWQSESAHFDPREGGLFSATMANGMNARGQFTELVAGRRVSFTWGWVDRPGIPPGATLVSIDLVEDGDGTRLILTHRDLPADEADQHRAGWELHLPRLADLAAATT